ncbi:cytochrome bc complex cytochrome b subunit [Actinoallomurus bryophytorum]|uniref:Cytochrome bc1 complex cytochrome b subunit n=1 Tax=Actinoallomurus bryophytorum TaxID=1490222 RepID=A0A543CCB3_9ACTN|nr:ubiquinol-cytochrome c reductase cytochrome b subunit [Actinoallomurus bryophytorum]TQL94716.1 menaquinol-cytochrome c reductase cytochrome b subunit precursor [Actinoallomurus bryophytorum]
MSTTTPPKAIDDAVGYADDRFASANFMRSKMKKVFPDHWSFMLGEIALYSFVILLLTGTFLTFWFKPSMAEVVYNGSYTKLHGVSVSEAYDSTLRISFDVRGGLLIRQIHHWAAVLFLASIMVHMLRIFFTGAYRKPREVNWLIGITMFTIAILEGLFGYSLPDDLLSGTGLRITQGVLQSIPVVGTYLYYFAFGGAFPGQDFIPRLYTIHVLLIPGILLALVVAHLMIMWFQGHTQYAGKGKSEKTVTGKAFYPVFLIKTNAFFIYTFAICAALATFAQINPIWLFGPYTPDSITAGSQPDFYMGFLEGALRIMPNWETSLWGHTVGWNVLIPALVPLGLIMTGAALWPFVEQWATGDRRVHHLADRPRNAPFRTAVGMTVVAFYGFLWLAGGNDILADRFHVSLYATTWFFRGAVFIGPAITYVVTKRICIGLQRSDVAKLDHGVESGIIKMMPSGEFVEVHEPVKEEAEAVLRAKPEPLALPAAAEDENGIPSPGSRGPLGRARKALNTAFVADDIPNGHTNGHNGHGDGHEESPEVGSGDHKELSRG